MAEKDLGNKKSDAALREERILKFWKDKNIFNKTLEKDSPEGEFVFYEGPPTANGKPGIHHLEARAFKDVIPRYKTMRGYHVRRKGGWDTHGLPVELQVEKKLGLNSKRAIEEYGIAKFNHECQESVWEYVDLWFKFTERIGFWVDLGDAYVTYHNNFIESVWNIVKKINERKLLYKDYKVVPWCPRCGTALSSHELAQGYEDDKDLSVTVKFKVKGQENTYILAWTTTPWTLPGNLALAVGEKIDYVKIKSGDEFYILAKARLSIMDQPYEIITELKGKDLIGLEYEPLYPYLAKNISDAERSKLEKAYKVYGADFVTTEDGTGVVHTAVMYGQDDFTLGTKIGLPKHHLVNPEGKFTEGTEFLENRFVKDEETAVEIIKDLAHRGFLLKKERFEHSYPHCWRCKTALIYYARDSWYIKMSDSGIKKELIKENEKINWEPAHIREGRFGEWLREIKDWAISRERYWGTPLPVWTCDNCKKTEVFGSVEEIKNKTKKSGNKYFVMRHGEAENNILNVCSSSPDNTHHLTEKGKKQVAELARSLNGKKIDMIFASPFLRTRETTDIITKIINLPSQNIKTDSRLMELNDGIFANSPVQEVYDFFEKNNLNKYDGAPEGGETLIDVKKRVGEFIYEIDEKYQNKNILIITHEDTIWALLSVINGLNKTETMTSSKINLLFLNAEIREFDFVSFPHNENYELDLHRPYIDEIKLVCTPSTIFGKACGGNLTRAKEVMDVWFDSGAMPFAQDHYPFENKKWVEGKGYPADFISEAIDQTRGWFYTLHAIGVLMGRGKAYKNVICLGHLLDADGKKMSKSVGNVVDPWVMIEKYGVDTLRLWMYSVNQPGESKNFDEKTVSLLYQQVFGLLYNVLTFYELYRDKKLENREKALPLKHPRQGLEEANILDLWILARLAELTEISTKNLDNYKLLEPVRAIRDFVGDLSTWYLRRSRERVKGGDEEAKRTLYFVLKSLIRLLAPFAPFTAEDIWLKLKNESDKDSVHLTEWLKAEKVDKKVIEKMKTVRMVVSLGLEARQNEKIPVRQPLGRIEIKDYELNKEYIELIKDELNIKEVIITKKIDDKVLLDTGITPELKQEGSYRELIRALQDMRKKMGLTPSNVISLRFDTNDAGKELIQKFENDMKKTVLASKVEFGENNGEIVNIDELVFKIKIEK